MVFLLEGGGEGFRGFEESGETEGGKFAGEEEEEGGVCGMGVGVGGDTLNGVLEGHFSISFCYSCLAVMLGPGGIVGI